ncbi:MAG TPA: alcohol dehydrogenase catalytic domain-containing protein, partial [Gaiellaceae bacterium]|nr:alcohol dehydrogenase catalytic domain-containing protein [Gaiellaceae bacterium]
MRGLAKLAPGPGNVGLAERDERAPGPGEVIVSVRAAGVCGTDLHIELDEFASFPPVTMGHEVAGAVSALGEGVDPAWLGARVVCETYFSTCGVCEWCREGRPNLCPERRSIGSAVDGGFAAQVVVPARNLHRIPDWLDEHAAPLAEPLACVCHCLCDPSAVAPGDRVVVTGAGPVGLLAAQVSRALGGEVLVIGLASDTTRLAAARALGFETGVADDSRAFARFEPRLGADVVVECSGSAGGARACLEVARRGSRYVQIGVFGRPVTVPLDLVFEKELVVTSGFASTPRSWRRAVSLVERRSVELEPLVSDVVPLTAWESAFADLRAGRARKIVFAPRLALPLAR